MVQQAGSKPQGKKISWEELAKHNVGDDCWMAVRGKVYNVTDWVPKHPGGYDTIVLNGGRDGTQLFEAYHPIKTSLLLQKYYVGEVEYDGEHPYFPPMSPFYIELKQKIENYFIDRKMSPRYAPEMLIRTAGLITFTLLCHYLAITTSSLTISVILAALMGVGCALISFMPVHEGSHASTTESPLVWRLMGAVHDFVNGASFYTWLHQHFLGHHPFTNVTNGSEKGDAIDPDVFTNDPDIRRIKPHQRWYQRYKVQHLYVPVLYGLLGIKYRINDFVITYSLKTNGVIRMNPMTQWHEAMFLGGKAFFVFYRIIAPAIYFVPLWQSILLFVVSDLITSYILAFVFQVNHVIPQAKWPTVDPKTGFVDWDWAKMQIGTTLDYAHGDWMTTFLTGALNYQVTHHLFPYISQVHYPEIAPIIREHCKKYGVEYHVLPTFTDAFKAHIQYLAIMGHDHADFH
eukprot:TRINITY_DN11221_c0_g1_i1.p1 TRINITY_DN11221_c0_g1~~TRINITY_DN11221_c0_g1_i1.p1  ORF type:complete len:458 (+),score=100.47 TRINITY_DN11221_c0_g1_i1:78-1451(+)